ncbi:MAG: MarR family transcriptional regulator [Euryarchaeota archaeon]|nr:MarR family transcriptional regulator [Euryarchaeota archaeon]
MHPALVAGLAGIVAIGGTVAAAHQTGFLDALFHEGTPSVDCTEAGLVPAEAGSGKIDFRITTDAAGGSVHLCVFDMQETKIWEYKGQVAATSTQDFLAEMPSGSYYPMVLTVGSGGGEAMASSYANLRWCSDGYVMEVMAHFAWDGKGIGGGTGGSTCGTMASQFANQGMARGDDVLAGEIPDAGRQSGSVVAAGLGLGSLVGLGVWRRRELMFLAAGLFTRLEKPTILDQSVRGRIYELVTHEPGIHGSAISERLELAAGQTVHHLRVLLRERMLSRVTSFGAGHYFPHGKYSPQQMRLLAALKHRAANRLYQSVLAQPGTTLTDASRQCGLSLGRASRVAQRLVAAGLVHRQPQGRTVVLSPALAAPA